MKTEVSKRCLLATGTLALLATLMMSHAVAQQARSGDALRMGDTTSMEVPIYRSGVLRLDAAATRISVGNPDIADILIIRANQLYVLGKDLGTTNVLLWDRDDNLVGTVNVEVTHDIESLKAKLHTMLPDDRIEVHSSQRSIVLRGQVSSATNMDAALRLARTYLAQTEAMEFEQEGSGRAGDTVGEVINLMQVAGAQQVMLEVKVAEISRSVLKQLDSQINAIHTGTGNWTLGGSTGPSLHQGPGFNFQPLPAIIERSGIFASFLSNSFLFDMVLGAAKENGMAKVLAEPTLTTLTGEEARFLSGGEFPVPVPQGLQGITVEFREFGVGLGFLPVVLGGGIINARLNISVSEISDEILIEGFLIPRLAKRSASVTVELREGQTLGIAGLISESMRERVTRFPGLGDIPVLGQLFRSQEFERNETELVILVTPYLAKPIPRDQIRLPTDGYQEPSDFGFYLLGRMADRRDGPRPPPANRGGGTEASFGHRVE
jgi:pilus assembly protein CpaC